jgi:hypothetical protein
MGTRTHTSTYTGHFAFPIHLGKLHHRIFNRVKADIFHVASYNIELSFDDMLHRSMFSAVRVDLGYNN